MSLRSMSLGAATASSLKLCGLKLWDFKPVILENASHFGIVWCSPRVRSGYASSARVSWQLRCVLLIPSHQVARDLICPVP